jgi:hypothetical protein
MVAVPAETPTTMPVPDPTLATAPSLLLHVPPIVESFKVIVVYTHATLLPKIADGAPYTDTVVVTNPHKFEYVIVAVPGPTAETMPLTESIVAIAVSLLLQMPPDTVLVRGVVKPTQTEVIPEIAEGEGTTVKVRVA